MFTLLRLNLIVNLCQEAWPQVCLIDSFVMWMWYLSRERCLLLAPHAAMLSLSVSRSQSFSLHALILRGNQLVDQNNYCQYGHVYVCIWIITVIPRWETEKERVKRVIRTSTYSVCSLTDGTCSHTGGTRSEAHAQKHMKAHVCTVGHLQTQNKDMM